MKFLELSKVGFLLACFALILVFNVSFLTAQETTNVSGTIVATEIQTEHVDVGDLNGHVVGLVTSEGTNTNTGNNAYMKNAKVTTISSSDLLNGNGEHHGYTILTLGRTTTYAKWNGTITTTTTGDGTTKSTVAGTFQFVYGTGKYENIKGSGTYRGKMTSENTMSVDWQGEYYIWDETKKTGVADY
jgi:hypothetical protein